MTQATSSAGTCTSAVGRPQPAIPNTAVFACEVTTDGSDALPTARRPRRRPDRVRTPHRRGRSPVRSRRPVGGRRLRRKRSPPAAWPPRWRPRPPGPAARTGPFRAAPPPSRWRPARRRACPTRAPRASATAPSAMSAERPRSPEVWRCRSMSASAGNRRMPPCPTPSGHRRPAARGTNTTHRRVSTAMARTAPTTSTASKPSAVRCQ